nr:uncharacterized protein CI109_006261 [Kwoniella shandongensis]KAA5525457.1 hypothetical protein CI109_006261 [Kwoniella shandongensis]
MVLHRLIDCGARPRNRGAPAGCSCTVAIYENLDKYPTCIIFKTDDELAIERRQGILDPIPYRWNPTKFSPNLLQVPGVNGDGFETLPFLRPTHLHIYDQTPTKPVPSTDQQWPGLSAEDLRHVVYGFRAKCSIDFANPRENHRAVTHVRQIS